MTGYEPEWAAEYVAYKETQACEDTVHESYEVTAPCVRCGQLIFLLHDPYVAVSSPASGEAAFGRRTWPVALGGTPTQYEHERCGEDADVEPGR